jgi:hypothetical protein
MASFQNVRQYEPSASAGGFGTFSISSSDAGLFHAAARTASAPSELATLQGNHAVQSTPERLTETQRASQLAAFSIRSSAFSKRGEARG